MNLKSFNDASGFVEKLEAFLLSNGAFIGDRVEIIDCHSPKTAINLTIYKTEKDTFEEGILPMEQPDDNYPPALDFIEEAKRKADEYIEVSTEAGYEVNWYVNKSPARPEAKSETKRTLKGRGPVLIAMFEI
jgi:hypothetical protein